MFSPVEPVNTKLLTMIKLTSAALFKLGNARNTPLDCTVNFPMNTSKYSLEVKPKIPDKIAGLQALSENLLYSWQGSIRELFALLDRPLWLACKQNPKLFLRRIDEQLLNAAAQDDAYLEKYNQVLHWSRDYCQAEGEQQKLAQNLPDKTLVAYFCAEYGFHESLPIYAGGLGILAGDHCKAASDIGLNFVAVGLLYHEGYFTQLIDARGQQIFHYQFQSFVDSPITQWLDDQGNPVIISVPSADEDIAVKLWRVSVGRIQLVLLDADIDENSRDDRLITRKLYGGDSKMRLQQEMILGIGGVRALAALGIEPTVWHINEGHAAFSVFERILQLRKTGKPLNAALEEIAGASVFTMHTPIAAGHDRFDPELIIHYFNHYLQELEIDMDQFMALGKSIDNQHQFNMTALALRGSRFHNAVSRIHGGVASQMEQYLWPQVPADENPISYITNGIHVETFLHKQWSELFDRRLAGWRENFYKPDYWKALEDIDSQTWWSVHRAIKQSLLAEITDRLRIQYHRNGLSEALIERSIRYLCQTDEKALVIGFARRFTSYKRAGLLFLEMQRLAELVGDPQWPVIFVFAGKAHPSDDGGKELIKMLYEKSLESEFIGRIILLEGYDISLARMLVSGCDIWLNTPQYPMEACGTSGQKAGVNGVVNLSIRDGWWAEGYNGKNGWAVAPHDPDCDPEYRDRQEAIDILDIIQHQIIPVWQQRDTDQYPQQWIEFSKASMASIIAKYSARRMVHDYIEQAYLPAAKQGSRLAQSGQAELLADWKQRVLDCWSGVSARRIDQPVTEINLRQSVSLRVKVNLNGLDTADILVECLVGKIAQHQFCADSCIRLAFQAADQNRGDQSGDQSFGDATFSVDWTPTECGLKEYRLRLYPYHELLSHPFELGCMLWL